MRQTSDKFSVAVGTLCFPLSQGFSNGPSPLPGSHGAVLWGPRAEAFTK